MNTCLSIRLKGCLNHKALNVFAHAEMVSDDPDLVPMGFCALDERLGREALDNPQAKAAILRLTSADAKFEFQLLLFQPDAIQLQIHRFNIRVINSENLGIWVNNLLTLAKIAESLPSPDITSVASAKEGKTRSNCGDFILPILGVNCGIIVFFMATMMVMIFLFTHLSKRGF